MKAFSPEEARRFLRAASQYRDGIWYPLFQLALSTGTRPEEYLGLCWKNVFNLDAPADAFISIQKTVCWKRSARWYWGEPKTLFSRRRIPLPTTTVHLLNVQRVAQQQRREWYEKRGIKWEDNDLVFTNLKGNPGWPVNSRSLLKHLKKILAAARLDTSLSLYSLRHSYATLLFMRKVHPKLVSARLGHSSVAITLDIYTHVIPMDYGDTEAIENVLHPADTGTYSAHTNFEQGIVALEQLEK